MTNNQKEIRNLTKESIVSFYNKTNNWAVVDIVDFENKRVEIYNQDPDYYDENLAGFDDSGYGQWSIETRSLNSWDRLDNAIMKFTELDSIDKVAYNKDFDFVLPCNDDFVLYNHIRFLRAIKRAKKGYKIDNNNNLVKIY